MVRSRSSLRLWCRRDGPRMRLAAGAVAVLALLVGASVSGAAVAVVAPSNLSLPAITGIAREGATLTADPGVWSGDAPISFAYKWEKCDANGETCLAVAGATTSSYLIPSSALGSTLRVAVTATNATGAATSRSFVSGVVSFAGTSPANGNLPLASGTVQQGKTLSATSGSWNGSLPITFAYQWQRCDATGGACTAIAGATTATYTLVAADTAMRVRAAVTATNTAGVGKAYSGFTAAVVAAAAPAVSTLPTITGTVTEGQTLTVSDGTWAGTAPLTHTYQWHRCDAAGGTCVAIAGATAKTYSLVVADVGHTLRASVKATNLAGTATALTLATTVAGSSAANAPASTSAPTIAGTAEVGGNLTANSGAWTGTSPLTFTYTWLACDANANNCVAIAGATAATYAVKIGDLARKLRVQVVAHNTVGSASATSAAVTITSPKAPVNTAAPVIFASSTTLRLGDVVTASEGSWLGATPIAITFQWTRCLKQETNCAPISGAKQRTYTIQAADVGFPIFVQIKAQNSFGSKFVNSQKTPAGISLQLRVATPPAVAGSAILGSTLTASPGIWVAAQPVTYTYQWVSCVANGSACSPIPNAKRATYTIGAADVGRELLVQIKAISGQASAFANSSRTKPVAAIAATATTIPVAAVVLPNRLVIADVKFQPTTLNSLTPFTARFKVTDASGRAVEGALVYALGIPYSWVTRAQELPTAADGWATVQITPTALLPLKQGSALVMFVRARKAGDNLLAGVSSRRLVQITASSRGLAARLGSTVVASTTETTPITGVALPTRLVISDVKFQPATLGSQVPFAARFRVTDTAGRAVQGALVYALGLPYAWVAGSAEVATDGDGWATVQVTPTAALPLKKGTALVMFVRARKSGENLLGGVSNRRLVQVVIR